jgi:hypothetical protein
VLGDEWKVRDMQEEPDVSKFWYDRDEL